MSKLVPKPVPKHPTAAQECVCVCVAHFVFKMCVSVLLPTGLLAQGLREGRESVTAERDGKTH